MGASIYWKPVRNDGIHLDVGLRSAFVAAFTRAFGSYPWQLNGESVPIIRGLQAAWDGQDSAALDELIEQIGKHGEIKVWPEY